MTFYSEYQVNNLHKHINLNLCKYCSLKVSTNVTTVNQFFQKFELRIYVRPIVCETEILYIQKKLGKRDA